MADDAPYLLQPWSSRFAKNRQIKDQKRYLGPPKKKRHGEVRLPAFQTSSRASSNSCSWVLISLKASVNQQIGNHPKAVRIGGIRCVPLVSFNKRICVNRFDQIRGPMRPSHQNHWKKSAIPKFPMPWYSLQTLSKWWDEHPRPAVKTSLILILLMEESG